MMTTARKWIELFSLALLAAVLAGCSPKVKTESFGHGYHAETKSLGKTTAEWTLVLMDNDHRKVVTQAIVESGDIQTFLPTPFGSGCTKQGYRDCPYLASVFCGAIGVLPTVVILKLDRSGKLLLYDKPFPVPLLKDVMKLDNGMVIVGQIELPIRLEYVQELMRAITGGKQPRGIILMPTQKLESILVPVQDLKAPTGTEQPARAAPAEPGPAQP